MAWLASCIKLIAEIALMARLGRWVLGWLAGPGHETNLFWRLLDTMCRPFDRLALWLGQGRVTAQRAGVWSALGLGLVWVAATMLKIWWCLGNAGSCR